MVPTFESTGMAVRFVETRDGHNWENWRDSLRDALSWIYPGPAEAGLRVVADVLAEPGSDARRSGHPVVASATSWNATNVQTRS